MIKLCEEAKDFCHKCYDRMGMYGYQCAFLNEDKTYCSTLIAIDNDVKTLKRLQDINIATQILNEKE